MAVSIIFETHSWSEDNEDGIAAVFTSDLRRAVETAEIAFAATDVPILHDWRLREADYGTGNGMPAAELHKNRMR